MCVSSLYIGFGCVVDRDENTFRSVKIQVKIVNGKISNLKLYRSNTPYFHVLNLNSI